MSSGNVELIKQSLKRAAGALRDAGVCFLVAGGLASWARGGPESGHDVDILVKPEDAQRAVEALEAVGMRSERPPEGWLFKAYDGDVLIDIIFKPSGLSITDEVLARGDELEVMAVTMPVMALEDLMVTKLASLREHELHYAGLIEVARSLREQIDWADVRARAPDNPFVRAFFTMVEGLGVVPPAADEAEASASNASRPAVARP